MSTLNRLQDLTRPTGEEELLDVAYPAPRLNLTLRHAAFAAAVVVLAATGILLLQAGGTEAGTTAPAPPTEFPAVSATSSAPGSGDLVVSVVGAVERPGLVTLSPGARVDDALRDAGPRPEADLVALNLAQRLSDGQQLVVPVVGEPAGAAGAAASAEPSASGGGVSLNSATAEELTELPGVGPATAAAIVAHRESTGGFRAVDELLDVKGIGPAKFESLQDAVTL